MSRPRCSRLLASGRQCPLDAAWLPRIEPIGVVLDLPICTEHRSFEIRNFVDFDNPKALEVLRMAARVRRVDFELRTLRVRFVPIEAGPSAFKEAGV